MSLHNGNDYLYLPAVQVSQQSLKATVINGLAVCTPAAIYVVPEGAVGSFMVANVFTQYFPGQNVRGGVEELLNTADDIAVVDDKLGRLLTSHKDTDLVFALDDLDKFKVHTWWFNMVTLKRPGRSVNRLIIKGSEHKSAFKRFYSARLGLAA